MVAVRERSASISALVRSNNGMESEFVDVAVAILNVVRKRVLIYEATRSRIGSRLGGLEVWILVFFCLSVIRQ